MFPLILQTFIVNIAQISWIVFMYLNENVNFDIKIEQKILKYNISFDKIKVKIGVG